MKGTREKSKACRKMYNTKANPERIHRRHAAIEVRYPIVYTFTRDVVSYQVVSLREVGSPGRRPGTQAPSPGAGSVYTERETPGIERPTPNVQHPPLQWHMHRQCAFTASYTRIVRTCVVPERCAMLTPPYAGGLGPTGTGAPADGGGVPVTSLRRLLVFVAAGDGGGVASVPSSSNLSPGMSCGQLKRLRRKLRGEIRASARTGVEEDASAPWHSDPAKFGWGGGGRKEGRRMGGG